MEAYENQTREVVNRFLHYGLSFPDCISALDAALADLVPRLTAGHLPALRAVMLANNARVMKEMELRGTQDADDPAPFPKALAHSLTT
jgi:hypothetical protein